MSIPLLVPGPPVLWRIGRTSDLFNTGAPTPLEQLREDDPASAGNRFDDPYGEFKTLYTAPTRRGCAFEWVAHFRPKPDLLDKINAAFDDGDDHDVDPPITSTGGLHEHAFRDRSWGHATMVPDFPFIDVDAAETHTFLNENATHLLDLTEGGLFHRGELMREHRVLTRSVAEVLRYYAAGALNGQVAGLRFSSHIVDEPCYAVWLDVARFANVQPYPLTIELPEIREAAAALGVPVLA